MGCDIHLYVEARSVDGKWSAVEAPPLLDKEDYDAWGWYRAYTDDPNAPEYQWRFGRSYFCFALLADVRNDGNVTPLSKPRGVPVDISEPVLAEYTYIVNDEKQDEDGYTSSESAARWVESGWSKEVRPGVVTGPDWHSASHFTLAELDALSLSGTVIHVEGYVNAEQYKEFKEKGRPSSWCKSVGGGGVTHVTNNDMERHIEQGANSVHAMLGQTPYTLVSWQASGDNYASRIGKLREEMRRVAAERGVGTGDIRTVFWFDN